MNRKNTLTDGKRKYAERRIAPIILSFVLAVAALLAPAYAQSPVSAQKNSPDTQKGMAANKLISLKPGQSSFEITQGKGEGRRIKMSIRQLPDSEKQYTLTFKSLYRLYLTRDADGSVHGRCLELTEKNKRITFDPALELVPSVIAVDHQIRATGSATLYDMDSGEQTNSGSYFYMLKGLSRTTFDTPAGPINGHLFEYCFEVDLGLSNVMLDLENGWSRERQLVYWRTKTTVEKLGLFGETTFRSLALSKHQPEPAIQTNP
jgi:hypothetical protein